MISTFKLVKIFFKEKFYKKSVNGKSNNFGKRLIILFAFFFLVYGSMFVTNYKEAFSNPNPNYSSFDMNLFPILVTINFGAFFFSLFSFKGSELGEKDLTTVCTLPIKESKIILAKLIIAFIFDSFFEVFISICALIAYILNGMITINGILILLVSPIVASIIPMCILSFLILILKKTINRSKYKRVFEIIGMVLMIIPIVLYSALISGSMLEPVGGFDLSKIYDTFLTYYPGLILVKLSIVNSNILYVFLYLIIALVLLCIFIKLYTKYGFKLLISDVNNSSSSFKKDKVEFKKNDINKTLLKKEFKKMFSSNVYLMNGPLMPLLMIIALFVVSIIKEGVLVNIFNNDINVYLLVTLGMTTFLNIMNYTSAFTLSLESGYTWLLFSLPLDKKNILFIKRLFNNILGFTYDVLIILITTIFQGFNILFILTILVFSIISNVSISLFYQYLNLKHPSLDGTDLTAIKQSTSVMILAFTMFPLVGVTIGSFIGMLMISSSIYLSILAMNIPFIIIGIIFFMLIKKRGEKLLLNFC